MISVDTLPLPHQQHWKSTSKPDVKRQGIGALNTMDYISQHLPTGRKAPDWYRWNTYGYCLRNIITAGEQQYYHDLYWTCIQERRRGLPIVLKDKVSTKVKIMAFAIAVSPTIFTRLEQHKIQKHLQTQGH